MAWYRTGTVNVTTGSTAVAGIGTSWISGASVGEGFYGPDGKIYEISAIVSATQLTLATPYLGSTQSTATYVIVPSQSYLRDLALQAATLVNDYASVVSGVGTGKFDDGTLASPGIRFTADENTGMRRVGADSLALVTGGSDRLNVTSSATSVTGNLGVGTSSPVANLHVNTTVGNTVVHLTGALGATASNGLDLIVGATGEASVWQRENSYLRFGTNNAERMRLDSSGNLGIGTVSPGAKVDVVGSIRASSAVLAGAAVGFDTLYMSPNGATGNGTLLVSINNAQTVYQPLTTDASTYIWRPNGTEQMRLTSAGNLGIGTSSPGAKLAVRGTYDSAAPAVSSTTIAKFNNGGAVSWWFGGSAYNYMWAQAIQDDGTNNIKNIVLQPLGGSVGIGGSPSGPFDVIVGGVSRLLLDASGNLGIGTATVLAKLDVVGGNGDGLQYRTSTRTIGIGQVANEASLYWGSGTALTFFSGSERMRLDSSGNLGLGVTPSAWAGGGKAIQVNARASLFGFSDDVNTGLNTYYDGSVFRYIQTGFASLAVQTAGQHRWFTAPSGTAGNAISFTQAMTLDASGNLGIGTSSPTTRLTVSGTGLSADGLRVESTSTSASRPAMLTLARTSSTLQSLQSVGSIQFSRLLSDGASNTSASISVAGSNDVASPVGTIYFDAITSHVLRIAGSDKATLNSSGNLLVGTSTNTNSSKVVSAGSISETVGSTQYLVASSYDIGTAANQVPLNQYLGSLAYQDATSIAGQVGLSVGSAALPSLVSATDVDTGLWFPAANTVAVSTSGAERLRLDSSGNLGIGTSSPGALLHLNGAGGGDVPRIRFTNTSTGTGATDGSFVGISNTFQLDVWNFENDVVRFATNNTERARLDSSGNLGLGVTPSAWSGVTALQIASSGAIGFNNQYGEIETNTYYNAGYKYIGTGLAAKYSQEAGLHKWFTAPSGTAGNAISFTQAMTLDTTTVGRSTLTLDNTTVSLLAMSVGGARKGYLYQSITDTQLFNEANGSMIFGTNATERARISSGGDLLVGTNTGSGRLYVKGSGATSSTYSIVTKNSADTNLLLVRDDGYVTIPYAYSTTTASAANVFVDGNGGLLRSTSSLRYKKDVADATHGLAEVLQLRPVVYKGKTSFDGNKVFGGLIAEEVHAIGLTEFVDYDADDQPDALHYGHMVSLLAKAIQEQQALIQALTARVTALEA